MEKIGLASFAIVVVLALACTLHCLTNDSDDSDFFGNMLMGSLCLT